MNPLYNQSRALPESIPSYLIYGRQQHHGQLGGYVARGQFTSPLGFGHGGVQGNFSRSQYDFDRNRAANFEFGPLSGNFDAFTSTEWLDRLPTTLSHAGTEEWDGGFTIVSGGIDTTAQLEVSERGLLEFKVGVGFDYYPDARAANGGIVNDKFDLQVLPSTSTSYQFGIGEAQFSIYSRYARFRNRAFSYYSLDPLDYADYQDGALGISVELPFNDRVKANLGYEFDRLSAIGDQGLAAAAAQQLLDHDTQNVFAGVSYSPGGVWEIGAQASASSIDYDSVARSDGSSATIGLFGNLPLSDYTRVSASAGLQRYEFDQGNGFDSSTSLASPYWGGSLENDLNDRITHAIAIGSGGSVGVSSNYAETAVASYNARWRIFDETLLTGAINYNRTDDSDSVFADDTRAIGYQIGVRQQLTQHTAVGINYSQLKTSSDRVGRDYDQQRLQAYCGVDLNERLALRASYQYWIVDSEPQLSSFSQNSVTVGINFNF